jgi:mono/diheme cytochrome c family protein
MRHSTYFPRPFSLRLLLPVLWLALVGACSEDKADDDDGGGGDTADAGDDDSDASAADSGDAGDQAVTWDNFAEGFFSEYCVSCHSPDGQASADFRDYDVVTRGSRPNSIRCGVAPDQLEGCEGEHPPGWFPIGNGPMPSEDERWTLVEWIENDTPR